MNFAASALKLRQLYHSIVSRLGLELRSVLLGGGALLIIVAACLSNAIFARDYFGIVPFFDAAEMSLLYVEWRAGQRYRAQQLFELVIDHFLSLNYHSFVFLGGGQVGLVHAHV